MTQPLINKNDIVINSKNGKRCLLENEKRPVELLSYAATADYIPTFSMRFQSAVLSKESTSNDDVNQQAPASNPKQIDTKSSPSVPPKPADLEKPLENLIENFNTQSAWQDFVKKVGEIDHEIKNMKISITKLEKQKQQAPTSNLKQNNALFLPSLPPDQADLDKYFGNLIGNVNTKSSKEDLVTQINKIDHEIKNIEASLIKLKKQKEKLESATHQPNEKENFVTQAFKYQSLAQQIYMENRRKAVEGHGVFKRLGPEVDLPLYNQPCDSSVYNDNKRKGVSFKKILIEHLFKKKEKLKAQEKYIEKKYLKLLRKWHKKVNKIESSEKRKAKQLKYREFFKQVFPELEKQQLDKKKNAMKNLEKKEKMLAGALIIPTVLFNSQWKLKHYVDKNGLINDPDYEKKVSTVWTTEEIELFKNKFVQYPKKFSIIASFLKNKSVRDCVQFYYLSKKRVNYKHLVGKKKLRSTRIRGKENNPNVRDGSPNDLMDIYRSHNLQPKSMTSFK